MMDYVLKVMDFTLKMMDFTLKLVDFTLKLMDLVTKNAALLQCVRLQMHDQLSSWLSGPTQVMNI